MEDENGIREKLAATASCAAQSVIFLHSGEPLDKKHLKEIDDFVKYSPEADIFIISSPLITQEIFRGLQKILYAAEKHACVSPRLSGGGLLCVPPSMGKNSLPDPEACFKTVSEKISEYRAVPFADPACALLKGRVINKFGLFAAGSKNIPEAFAAWCLAVNRYGYSSVSANRFFLKTDAFLADTREALSQSGFPYAKKNAENYLKYLVSPYERFAEQAAGTGTRKPRVLLCMHQLVPVYNGTSEHAFATAKRLVKMFGEKYEFTLLISKENSLFFNAGRYFERIEHPDSLSGVYDLGITFIQIYFNSTLNILNRHCFKIIMTVLDMIVFRSGYLNKDIDTKAFGNAAKFCDGIITISEFTKKDLLAYFPQYETELEKKTKDIPISFSQTTLEASSVKDCQPPFAEYILVFGNSNEHKLLKDVYKLLPSIRYNFVVVGYKTNKKHKNIKTYDTGGLNAELIENLYARSSALLFPSDYEGFGLPILHSLKYGKKVIVSGNEVNKELEKIFDNAGDRFIYFNTLNEIGNIIEKADFSVKKADPLSWTYDDTASETEKFIERILKEPTDTMRLELRDEVCLSVEYSEKKSRKLIKQYIKENLMNNHPLVFKTLKKIKKALFQK